MSERPGSLQVKLEEAGQALVVRICGSVSIDEADRLRTELDELAARKAPTMVLDLSKMSFICSSGLGAIISAHIKSRHHQGQIRVVNPQPAVRNLLETTRLIKLFPVYPTVDEALAS
jgi:anti-sigma B factor antagonist